MRTLHPEACGPRRRPFRRPHWTFSSLDDLCRGKPLREQAAPRLFFKTAQGLGVRGSGQVEFGFWVF